MEGSFAGIAGRSTFAVVSKANIQQLLPQLTSGPLQQSPAEDQELRSSLSLSNSAANSAVYVRAPLVVPVPGPATSNVVAPVFSLPPTPPAVYAPADPISQDVFPCITRKSRKPREWPSFSRSSARLAAKNRRSFLHSPARSTASNPTSTLNPAQLATVPPSEDPSNPLDPVQDTQEAVVPANND
jgi:hypothetical protein